MKTIRSHFGVTMILACATLTAYAEQPATASQKADAADCDAVAMSLNTRISADPSVILAIVSSEVAANPSCSCEIVKGAIVSSDADVELVADIVETAITAAPENMRLIAQCAIATKPQALSNVQAVLARLDPNSGDSSYSAKDAKSGKDAAAAVLPSADPIPDILALPNSPFTVIAPNTTVPGDVSNPNNPDAPGFVSPGIVTDPNPGAASSDDS